MEGLRKKCESKDFSPLAELKALARILLDTLDNTVVYEFVNINRDPSLKPSIKPIQNIKQYHCFQFVDCDHVDCCIMCGDTFPPVSHRFQSVPRLSATIKKVDEDDNNDKKDERSVVLNHIQEDQVDMELDVDVDDEKEDIDITEPVIEREHQSTSCTTTTTSTSTLRRSKRQRTSLTTFSSSQGSEYLDLDDLDLD